MPAGRAARVERAGSLPAALLACLVGLACAARPTYEGERLPRADVAVVAGMLGWNPLAPGVTARVEAIDGIRVEGSAVRVEILPGRRELVLFCRWDEHEARIARTVELEAGRTYQIAVGLDDAGRPDAMVVADQG